MNARRYRQQVADIRTLLRARGLAAVRVGTVDDYQGQEQKALFPRLPRVHACACACALAGHALRYVQPRLLRLCDRRMAAGDCREHGPGTQPLAKRSN